MEADVGGAGPGDVGDDAVDRPDHQVHVDRRGHAVLAQRLAHQWADGEVGHVVVVHHVEVHTVGDRQSDVEGTSVPVRVDLGRRRIITKHTYPSTAPRS